MCVSLLSYYVENGHFRFCCRTNNLHIQQKSKAVISKLAFKAIRIIALP